MRPDCISSTPCPIQCADTQRSHSNIYSKFGYDNNDENTTANIDFTTEFRASFRNVKPRRRGSIAPGNEQGGQNVQSHGYRRTIGGRAGLDFVIHEDVHDVPAPKIHQSELIDNGRGIRQPPQRPGQTISRIQEQDGAQETGVQSQRRPAVSFASLSRSSILPASDGTQSRKSLQSNTLARAPRRPILKSASATIPEVSSPTSPANSVRRGLPRTSVFQHHELPTPKLAKPSRRGTIYIPPDDTTMPSMYMDMFSPIQNLRLSSAQKGSSPRPRSDVELTGIAAQMYNKKQRPVSTRKSLVLNSPKRLPLQNVRKQEQTTRFAEDIFGQGGGKENMPPGAEAVPIKVEFQLNDAAKKIIARKSGGHGLLANRAFCDPLHNPDIVSRLDSRKPKKSAPSTVWAPTASSSARNKSTHDVQPTVKPRPAWNAGIRPRTADEFLSRPPRSPTLRESAEEHMDWARQSSVPSHIVAPSVRSDLAIHQYPLLDEGLSNLSLYEEKWLSHQEIVIRQLVNDVFDTSNIGFESPVDDLSALRRRFLDIYNESSQELIYKRLQVALMYGSLSIPKEVLADGGRLYTDLGRRKAFTDFWLQTYDPASLQCALEVVIGRQCTIIHSKRSTSSSNLNGTTSSASTSASLQTFIEIFLIRNEDSGFEATDGETTVQTWSYQRTVLRSLMLIRLLDQSSTSKSTPNHLFQLSSIHKSSQSVLQGLFKLLNPSAGDPIRALSHLNYTGNHVQLPLEEFEYNITNLATDFRDGIRLTRLVELLLYPSTSSLQPLQDTISTITTQFLQPCPNEIFNTSQEISRPLSKHLKFPCLSRATKVSNVQIALDALKSVKGFESLLQTTLAEDIVDGYREKTVSLLWKLCWKWGLGRLIAWKDVRGEIGRLKRLGLGGCAGVAEYENWRTTCNQEDVEDDFSSQKASLRTWAHLAARASGVEIRNFRTSFADGRAFGAIVQTYEPFLVGDMMGLVVEKASFGSTSNRTNLELVHGSTSLQYRLAKLGCSQQFVDLFKISDRHGSSQHQHIFDRDFVLAALAFLCSRLLAPSRQSRAAICIQHAWRRYWDRTMEKRKHTAKRIAEACADAALTKESSVTHHDHSLLCHRAMGNVDHPADIKQDLLEGVFSPVIQDSSTGMDDDIWLSLSPRKQG